LNALIGIQQALYRRAVSGEGGSVKVSLFDSAVDLMAVPILHAMHAGKAPGPAGLMHPSIAPYGGFATADGETLLISIQSEREWASLCTKVLRREDLLSDGRSRDNNARVANRAFIDGEVAAVFRELTRAELEGRLRAADIAYGGINSVDFVTRHPQLRHWPMPVAGADAAVVAPPVRTDWDEGRFRAAPTLGQHSAAIRREFGG
jgi:crotonobetainyl-CoA:carnitine CoA-transferase CaiB-like acyl-CoA transferase